MSEEEKVIAILGSIADSEWWRFRPDLIGGQIAMRFNLALLVEFLDDEGVAFDRELIDK